MTGIFRRAVRLFGVAVLLAGVGGAASPIMASAAAGSLTQVATAVVNSSTQLAMSGLASCTGGGTDTIQTVVVSQGLTVGAVSTTSNPITCDGNMYPWGILEGTTLGSWAGGSNVTSIVAFTSSPLTTTNMATLTPASGTTLNASSTGSFIDSSTARAEGMASCTGGGSETIQIDYNEYDAGISASGSTSLSCDGTAHSWNIRITSVGGDWSGDPGMAVVNLQNGSSQNVATYTTTMGWAS
ncbi:MAG TPA: hypothetical protein VLF71_03515 [Candidatus Saccharimonadales bacterium]|nr:hypothetical protein [Candidatus Saccharimonadales bacterium]